MRVAILGVDVGGTFTDAVLVEDGRVRVAKVPTAARQEESVLAAARAVGAVGDVALERFAHGTTVATNALLERRGARTAYVGNAGFEHRAPSAAADAGAPLPAVRAPSRAASSSSATVTVSWGGSGRTASSSRSISTRCRSSARSRRWRCACSSPFATGARARGGGGVAAAVSRRARRRVARGRAGVPRVRARLDDRGRRVPRARAARYLHALAARRRRPSYRSRR